MAESREFAYRSGTEAPALPGVAPRNRPARSVPAGRALADLAGRQHGVVARRQLLEAGLSARIIHRLRHSGALVPIHRGVYAVGHGSVTQRGRWLAAVLASGPGATLSHRDAAALWGLRDSAAASIDVTVPHHRRAALGILLHCRPVRPDERTLRAGIPVTTPSRTLFDLASVLAPHALERAAAQAEYLRLPDRRSLADALERHRGRTGAAAVRTFLEADAFGSGITQSVFEERFVAFVDAHRLPRPQLNFPVWLGGREVRIDAAWPAQRLALELDSRAAHLTPAAFESDRRRDRALQVEGWRPVRLTWRQFATGPRGVAADLRALLSSRHAPQPARR